MTRDIFYAFALSSHPNFISATEVFLGPFSFQIEVSISEKPGFFAEWFCKSIQEISLTTQSITTWIGRMRSGDPEAVSQLWEACWQPVVAKAREMLNSNFRSVSDEEDIAASVLESVLMRAQAGDFSALNDSNSLWRLLWVVVERKVSKHVEYHLAQRRSVNKTVYLSNLGNGSSNGSSMPTCNDEPVEALALAESLEVLMLRLDEPTRKTAGLALSGHSPKEISQELHIKIWTVYSHLTYVRTLLQSKENE